jgi:hypothetical protein
MKTLITAGVILTVIAGCFVYPSSAALTVIGGKPLAVYADPSDVVIHLDTAGPCGSNFFHIQRTSQNFKELTSAALTALSLGKGMHLFVSTCASDRNILSHGAVMQ